MKALYAIIIFIVVFLAAITLAAVLAWPVYMLSIRMADVGFARVSSHTTVAVGLIASLLYLRHYRGLSLATLGYRPPRKFTQFLHGFVIGLALMIVLEASLLLAGVHRLDDAFSITWGSMSVLLSKALLTGLVITLIEETIFRGALYGGLQRQVPVAVNIIFISLLYAVVHYLRYPAPGPDPSWSIGLTLLPQALSPLAQPGYYDALFTLFMLGVLLGMMRRLSANLITCIGLHTAVVLGDKAIGRLSNPVPDAPLAWLANQHDAPLGHAGSFWLIVFCIVYYVYETKRGRGID